MKLIKAIIFIFCYYISINFSAVYCQTKYSDCVLKDEIRTVLLHKEGWELSYPVIDLGSDAKLKLSFDDLGEDVENYSYSLLHCNADWTLSQLNAFDYVEGFNDQRITNYSGSVNTTMKYIHYSALFPNEDLKIKISGNYILKVFRDSNADDVVLMRRFLVVDNFVKTEASIRQALSPELKKTGQEITTTIKTKGLQMINPEQNLKLYIVKNFIWQNAHADMKPLFIRDGEIVYGNGEDNVFEGGSEFRFFDTKSFRYQSERVHDILFHEGIYNIKLADDDRRANKKYELVKDLNGKFMIQNQQGQLPETDADYCKVYFSLPLDAPLIDSDIYVAGFFSAYERSDNYKLKYSLERKQYEASLLLKQGYYNYQYFYSDQKTKSADFTYFEGNHFETENDYLILVYYRDFSDRYDKLCGFQIVNSVIREK